MPRKLVRRAMSMVSSKQNRNTTTRLRAWASVGNTYMFEAAVKRGKGGGRHLDDDRIHSDFALFLGTRPSTGLISRRHICAARNTRWSVMTLGLRPALFYYDASSGALPPPTFIEAG